MRAAWALAVLTILVMGCGGSHLVVDSDTSWAGNVDGFGAISGQGKADYDLRDAGRLCWEIAKLTDAGTLRAYSTTSEWFGLGTEINGEATTTAPRGTVRGCM